MAIDIYTDPERGRQPPHRWQLQLERSQLQQLGRLEPQRQHRLLPPDDVTRKKEGLNTFFSFI